MVVTYKVPLPSDEELTTQEINLSWPVLHAASFYIGKYCENHNLEFMLCRKELEDPTQCIKEGKEVTSCALDMLQKLKKHCHEEFDQFFNCVYRSSPNMSFQPCHKTREVLDKCVLDKIGVERPPFGYFAEAKIHDSKRPKPELVIPEYPQTPKLPEDAPRPPARFNGRSFWET